jgi:hypothetical protein
MWLLFVPAGTGPVYFESGSEQSIENDWVLSLLLWKWIVCNIMYYKIVFLIEISYWNAIRDPHFDFLTEKWKQADLDIYLENTASHS